MGGKMTSCHMIFFLPSRKQRSPNFMRIVDKQKNTFVLHIWINTKRCLRSIATENTSYERQDNVIAQSRFSATKYYFPHSHSHWLCYKILLQFKQPTFSYTPPSPVLKLITHILTMLTFIVGICKYASMKISGYIFLPGGIQQ